MRVIIIIFFLLSYISFARNTTNDLKIMDNGDTVRITRSEGKISFGANSGASYLFNNGNILLPFDPDSPLNVNNELEEYEPNFGYGIRGGLFFEYKISGSIGISIDLHPLYYNRLTYNLINAKESIEQKQISSGSYYFSFIPALIVYFENYELSAGMSFNHLLQADASLRTDFSNTSKIEIEEQINFSPLENTTGFLVSIRYDLVTALVSDKMRFKASPFLRYSYIPNFFETFSTSSSNNSIEIGINLSLGFDRIKIDTLKWNGFQKNINDIEKDMQLTVDRKNIETKNIKEIDIDIHEPDFAESPPVGRVNLDLSMREYLEYLVELINSGSAEKIEIIAFLSEKEKKSLTIKKVKAIISFLRSKGIKDNSIIITEDHDSNLEKSKVEINIVNQ